MKKQRSPRKLVLEQEAIRTLSGIELAQIAGADPLAILDKKVTDSCVCGTTVSS
ncbi:MAG TPA: hypothetical protein VFK02_21215 [Kofleriaceae bacterium]|nr:hypothetical protein [Kofleriaceae bacterium]